MDLNETEKVAVLLVALGPKRAQRILDRLSTDELVLIVDAMKRLGTIDQDVRRQVLEEVNEILQGLTSTSGEPASEPSPPEAPGVNLFTRLGPYLPEKIDPARIDWDAAGFDFDDEGDNGNGWRRRGESHSGDEQNA